MTRFRLSPRDWGTRRMSWGEAVRAAETLAADPSSHICAAVNGWDHPASHELMALANLYDLWSASDEKPYPRPWPDLNKKVVGKGTELTKAQFQSRWAELAAKAEQRRLRSAS